MRTVAFGPMFFHRGDAGQDAGDCHRHFRRFREARAFNFGRGWGPRARRGDIKYLVLEALAAGPRHGYDVIRTIEERRGFRPSAGSIYPTLQMLEDGGLVTGREVDGKRVYAISDAGREVLSKRDLDGEDEGEPEMRHRLRAAAMKLMAALAGARDSDEATLERIRAILDRARKEIYGLLAADQE